MDRTQSQTPNGIRARGIVRLVLGFLQMFGAVFSATLLLQTGVTRVALILRHSLKKSLTKPN
jgi:hypothetical protein